MVAHCIIHSHWATANFTHCIVSMCGDHDSSSFMVMPKYFARSTSVSAWRHSEYILVSSVFNLQIHKMVHLDAWNCIPQWLPHSSNHSRSSCRICWSIVEQITLYNRQLSAKSLTWVCGLTTLGKSFI